MVVREVKAQVVFSIPPMRGKVTYRTVQQLAIVQVLATGFGALRSWILFANQ